MYPMRSNRRSSRTVTAYLYVEPEGPTLDGEGLGELEIEITGTCTPYIGAKLSGHPDTWAPAEGGDVEDITATLDNQPFELTSDEEDKAAELLAEKAAESYEDDDGPDPDDFDDFDD